MARICLPWASLAVLTLSVVGYANLALPCGHLIEGQCTFHLRQDCVCEDGKIGKMVKIESTPSSRTLCGCKNASCTGYSSKPNECNQRVLWSGVLEVWQCQYNGARCDDRKSCWSQSPPPVGTPLPTSCDGDYCGTNCPVPSPF